MDSKQNRNGVQEAFKFAELASDGLLASSELAGPFRNALDEFHADVLGAVAATALRRDHFRFSGTLMSDDPVADMSNGLGQAAESDFEFGQYLRSAVADGSLIEPGTS